MKHESGLEEPRAKVFFAQMVNALAYCHRQCVVHRDLKPENIVICSEHLSVKLTDFGFSNVFEKNKTLQTSCGSLAYSAPEILLGEEYDASAVGKRQTTSLWFLATLYSTSPRCMVNGRYTVQAGLGRGAFCSR